MTFRLCVIPWARARAGVEYDETEVGEGKRILRDMMPRPQSVSSKPRPKDCTYHPSAPRGSLQKDLFTCQHQKTGPSSRSPGHWTGLGTQNYATARQGRLGRLVLNPTATSTIRGPKASGFSTPWGATPANRVGAYPEWCCRISSGWRRRDRDGTRTPISGTGRLGRRGPKPHRHPLGWAGIHSAQRHIQWHGAMSLGASRNPIQFMARDSRSGRLLRPSARFIKGTALARFQ